MAQTVKLEFVQRHHNNEHQANSSNIETYSAMYMYQLILFNLIRARTYNKFQEKSGF